MREVESAKIKNLTELIENKLGVRPVSYRAARYGADLDTIKALQKLGYKVDSSVTPEMNWRSQGGPDHSRAPKQPYFISQTDYYSPGRRHDSGSADYYFGKEIAVFARQVDVLPVASADAYDGLRNEIARRGIREKLFLAGA